VITDARLVDDVLGAELALRGGATAVQMRMKGAPTRVMVEKGKRIRKLCHEYGALFIVNDRVDVALATGADGVHLGKEDMKIEDLLNIMERLRDKENGCPWDKEQTFESLRHLTIEETYELSEAVFDKDVDSTSLIRFQLHDLHILF